MNATATRSVGATTTSGPWYGRIENQKRNTLMAGGVAGVAAGAGGFLSGIETKAGEAIGLGARVKSGLGYAALFGAAAAAVAAGTAYIMSYPDPAPR